PQEAGERAPPRSSSTSATTPAAARVASASTAAQYLPPPGRARTSRSGPTAGGAGWPGTTSSRTSGEGAASVPLAVGLLPGVGVDFLQVDHHRLGPQMLQQPVAARVLGELVDAAIRVVPVAEHERVGGTGLGTGRLQLAVAHRATLPRRLAADPADALDAEGALLHHPLAADGDVRVELRGERLRPGRIPPVEEAHVVGAVVAAVAGADTAVVHLQVEPILAVNTGVHRADGLAGRVRALLAEHRQKARLHIRELALPVALDPDPLLGPVLQEALLLVDRDVVFRLAGDDARLAARAAIQVDRHAPLVRARLVLGLGLRAAAHLIPHPRVTSTSGSPGSWRATTPPSNLGSATERPVATSRTRVAA